MVDEKKEDQPARDEEVKKGKKVFLKLGIILAGVVTLSILGFLSWQFLLPKFLGDKKPAQAQSEVKQNAEPPGSLSDLGHVYPLDEFIVNLAGPSGDRFLKAKIELELESAEVGEQVKGRLPLIRDSILLILTTKTFEDVSTVDGKLKLKNEILSRINPIIGAGKVRAVYFTDFVIQ